MGTTYPTTTTPPKTTSYPRKMLRSTTSKSRPRSTSRSTIFQLQPSPRSLQLLEEEEREAESTTIDLDLLYSGQYHEDSQSEEYEVNNVKVDFDHQDNHKTYTVEAKAGDFIIGEVGKIDVNNGQTLEGVRYTALDGEVSQR